MPDDNNDQLPQDPKVNKATAKAIAALDKAADSSVGAQVFHQIEAMNLTNDQKQQIYRNIAADVTTKACTDLSDPATIMRGSSAGSQFMTAYMECYAAEYLAAVEQKAIDFVQSVELPTEGTTRSAYQSEGIDIPANMDNSLRPDNVPQAGFRSDPPDFSIGRRDLSASATDGWDDVYKEAGSVIVDAVQEQMPKLTPEARAFLNTCGEAARNTIPGPPGDSAATYIMSNTLALRGALYQVKEDSAAIKNANDSNDASIRGEVLAQACGVAQSYINFLPQNNKVSESSKPQNKIVNLIRDEKLEASRQVFSQASHGEVPNTPNHLLAPDNAQELVNQAVPGRADRIAAAVQPVGSKSLFDSVRDTLQRAGSSVKRTAADALDLKGSEQKLRDVDPGTVEIYKSLQETLKHLEREDTKSAIDAIDGDTAAEHDFKDPKRQERIDNIKEEMEAMKKRDPGLAQLDRSKVGQAVHTSIRDAAKSLGSRLH